MSWEAGIHIPDAVMGSEADWFEILFDLVCSRTAEKSCRSQGAQTKIKRNGEVDRLCENRHGDGRRRGMRRETPYRYRRTKRRGRGLIGRAAAGEGGRQDGMPSLCARWGITRNRFLPSRRTILRSAAALRILCVRTSRLQLVFRLLRCVQYIVCHSVPALFPPTWALDVHLNSRP